MRPFPSLLEKRRGIIEWKGNLKGKCHWERKKWERGGEGERRKEEKRGGRKDETNQGKREEKGRGERSV